MNGKLLTIVTSTYNRSELMEKNLSTILSYGIEEIEYIIGDNASTDDTWEMLQKYKSENVRIIRNNNNIGIANASYIAFNVTTPYYLILNDRDCIKKKDLIDILDFLKNHTDCEMIASFEGGPFFKEGYIYNTDFSLYYNKAEHPGELVYKTEFMKKNLDFITFKNLTENNEMIERSCYTRTQLQYNLKIGYHRSVNYVVQPENRDKAVPQVRKEMYGAAYILPEFQIPDFNSLISYAQRYSDKKKIASIILARYRISLYKVELEFHESVIYSDFKNRNHCEDSKPSEWLGNGIKYTVAVLNNELISQYKIKNKIIMIFLAILYLIATGLFEEIIGDLLPRGNRWIIQGILYYQM